jgi:AcrR family transcriptional regulator
LDAAVSLFSRKGYAATSTREIAALIGIRKASLYYHIGSKEDLLFQICTSSLNQIRSDVAAAVQSANGPLEKARALVRCHVESMLRDQAEHLTALLEMRALSPEPLEQVMALRDSYENLVDSVLQEGQTSAALRTDIDGNLLRLYLLSLLNRTVIWHRPARHLPPGELGEVWASIFLSGTIQR